MNNIIELILNLKNKGVAILESNDQLKLTGDLSVLSEGDIDEIRQLKVPILEFLKKNRIAQVGFHDIRTADVQESYILSSAQRRLWILSQFEGGNAAYHMPGVFLFEGMLNEDVLESGFAVLIDRHEILRTNFEEDAFGEVRQYIYPAAESKFVLKKSDLREMSAEQVDALVQRELQAPFDLASGPLLRAGLYRLADQKWLFSYVMHHIISDGWSMDVLIAELLGFYNNALLKEGNSPDQPLRIQYKDYADWQQSSLKEGAFAPHKAYWMTQLSGVLPVLELPADRMRPAVKTYHGAMVNGRLSAALSEGLVKLSREHGCTLFMSLVAVVNTLLYRYSGQQDIIIGSPVAGRSHSDLHEQIGCYVNTLALRSRFSGTDRFSELLEQTRENTLGAYEHQDYPLDALVEELDLKRDLSRNPLFDVMLVLQESTSAAKVQGMEGLNISGYQMGTRQSSKFDLTFSFSSSSASPELNVGIEYNTDIYKEATVLRMLAHLELLVATVVSAADQSLDQLDYLSKAERETLLNGFNRAACDYPEQATLAALFEEQVLLHPERVAVVFKDRELNYTALNSAANRLAAYLIAQQETGRGDLVGICLERSEQVIIAILAVLKTGAAYVPVDPAYPAERIAYIRQDSNCKVMIDAAFLLEYTAVAGQYTAENPVVPVSSDDLAYVMYTSGSTGQPKGVVVAQKSVVRLVKPANYVSLSENECILSLSDFSFDGSVFDIFGALLHGTKLVIPLKETFLDFHELNKLIVENQVSIFFLTTALFNTLVEAEAITLDSMKYILFGGERVSLAHVLRFKEKYPDIQLVHVYGPTESTTFSSFEPVETVDTGLGTIPIGKPISNTSLYILGNGDRLVPVGVTGEICISGAGLARGYLNREALTKEKFVPNPYLEGELMYRTGDLGRWNSGGSIEFIGRKDDQVKVRGYRIELGEIEHVLQEHPAVNSVVVLAPVNDAGERFLAAYLVGSAELDIPALKAYLSELLPAYMVPAYFVQLDSFPLNANGKIDKKALPPVEQDGAEHGSVYQAAENETQAGLISIWTAILGVNPIGINDDFFELGGHSLKATRLISQIHKVFHVKIGLKELFANPVLRDQALLIQVGKHNAFESLLPVAQAESYVLSSSQRRLWVLSQFAEGNVAYNMAGVFYFEGTLDEVALEQSFAALISRHEILRTTFREDVSGEVRQYIHPAGQSGFVLERKDAQELSATDLQTALLANLQAPFDLAAGPLLRAGLYRVGEGQWIFSYAMHHIISDGWSMGVLIAELSAFYNADVKGSGPAVEPLKIHYKDYASWQQSELQGGSLASHKAYWLEQFSGELPVLELPADRVRPAVKTYNGAMLNSRLSAELTEGLNKLCRAQGCTLFMGLLSVVNTLLYRYSGQQDIVIGSPVAGREHTDLEGQIGFYVNTLALRSRFSGSDRFTGLLAQVRELTLAAYEHQAYPFDELVDELNLQRDLSRSALFDVMVVLQNMQAASQDNVKFEDLNITGYPAEQHTTSKFDLLFSFSEVGSELTLSLEYNTDLYDQATMKRFSAHLQQLIGAILSGPEQRLNELDYLTATEKNELLDTFNDTHQDYPEDGTVLELFETQVLKHAGNKALVFDNGSLTYLELNNRSNLLAHHIKNQVNVNPGDYIAVLLDRSEWSVITMIGIMKLGCVYIALDKELPDARIKFILEEINAKALLIDELKAEGIVPDHLQTIRVSEVNTQGDASNPGLKILNKNASFVIYTSGSTGNPKGVEQTHLTLYNLVIWDIRRAGLIGGIKHLQYSSFCFDSSLHDVFYSLATGGEVHVISESLRKNLWALKDYVLTNQIATLSMPYAALKTMFSEIPVTAFEGHSIREIISTGEQLYISGGLRTFLQQYPEVRLHNVYGPSETHVVTGLYYSFSEGEVPEKSTIGKPIDNSYLYILDEAMQLVPIGVEGDIYIGGANLATGYLGNETMTREKFIPDLFKPGETIYKSGDIGKWLPDGDIEYMGRKDNQVKINGYRIELEEIEIALRQVASIEDAIVIVKKTADGDQSLVAYYLSESAVEKEKILAFLGTQLAAYMLPHHYVHLEKFPLTTNGKVDKRALPEVDLLKNSQVEYVAPESETQGQLVEIWSGILGIDQNLIGIKNSFFDLGGHSLKATRLVSRIKSYFLIEITIKDVFMNPTIQGLSEIVDSLLWLKKNEAEKDDSVEMEKFSF
ncbi:amino acid adenylation domain-containing protein [Pedobacter sp. AW31-3R]|uniref:amino acid adenylation domain-containing protein n=1 Tax=Pedobacter sp. AW31-3R TaxID=3445781 RepID=UPI003F9FFF23